MFVALTRLNGSVYEREDWMPSTAIESLGEVEVAKTLPESQQRQRVADIEFAWREQQPIIEGRRVLLACYETHTLDESRPVQ